MGRVVFLIGASGAGKTTVAQVLEQRAPWAGNTHYFDSIGVPSDEVMAAQFGGPEGAGDFAHGQLGSVSARSGRRARSASARHHSFHTGSDRRRD